MPVRKGTKARPTQVHTPRRKWADKHLGQVFDDWFEQLKEETNYDPTDRRKREEGDPRS